MKKKCCVFTFVKNENIFLPIWLRYYSRYFDGADIYVINHDSDDGSIEACLKDYTFNVINLHHDTYDDFWKVEMARKEQVELLKVYEYVLYTDADEIIIPNPEKYKDLRDYISKVNRDCVICTAFELIHIKDEEPPIDLNRPILQQRKYGYHNYDYDKSLLANKPLEWLAGFHVTANNQGYIDRDFWLIHLHRMDFNLCWNKHQSIAKMPWNKNIDKKKIAWQFQLTNLTDFTDYFFSHSKTRKRLEKKRSGFRGIVRYVCFFKIWLRAKISGSNEVPSWRRWSQQHYPEITTLPKALRKRQLV